MKIETSSSNLKTWSLQKNEEDQSSHDLLLACVSFLVLLFVAVADATLRM